MRARRKKVVIRPARPDDLRAVYRLARASELSAPSHPAAEKYWIKDFLLDGQPFLVATDDGGKVVGFTLGECATGDVAIRHLTAVDPEHRRQGIGEQLVKAFEREARRRKMTCILMYVSGGAHWARTHRRLGYAAGAIVREYQKFL